MGLDRSLAEVASTKRMLVTYDDVVAHGGTKHHVRRRLESGRWLAIPEAPRVYRIAGAPSDWLTTQLAAVLSAGPGAVTSHLAAARLWGIPGFATAGVELAVPRGRYVRREDTVRVHESSDLGLCRVVERDGIPVTDPARTILDIARYVGPKRLGWAAEHLRRHEHLDWMDLTATLASHARKGRHGITRLRTMLLREMHRSEVTDTHMELLVLSLIREAGLPEPELHHRVMDGDRFVAEVDMAYPEHRIAIECDGSAHLDEDVRDADLPRQNDLVLLGWTVLRFSYRRVRDRPESVVAEIRAALAAAGQAA